MLFQRTGDEQEVHALSGCGLYLRIPDFTFLYKRDKISSKAMFERCRLLAGLKEDFTLNHLFQLQDLMKDFKEEQSYREFLRVPAMSAGIYRLKKGEEDKQTPHTEDEIYFVMEGEAKMLVGENNFEVKQGSVIYVEANLVHRFHHITQDLTVLVLFAPAEYSNR